MVKINGKYFSLILIFFLSLMTQITGQITGQTSSVSSTTDNSSITIEKSNSSEAIVSSSTTIIIADMSTAIEQSSTTKAPSGDLTQFEFILILSLGGGALIVMNIAAIICAVNQFKRKKKLEKSLMAKTNKPNRENIQLTELNQELIPRYNERGVGINENNNKKMSLVVNELVTKRVNPNRRHSISSKSNSSSSASSISRQSSDSYEENDEGNMRF